MIESTNIILNDILNTYQEIGETINKIIALFPEAVAKQNNPAFDRREYLDLNSILTSLTSLEQSLDGHANFLRSVAGQYSSNEGTAGQTGLRDSRKTSGGD